MPEPPDPRERAGDEPAISPGYRLVFILDPDGRIRQVLEASGIGGWPQEGYVGKTLGEVSAERAGAERGDLWDVRIELAREATVPALYLDRVPGAPVDDPATVSSTVIPVRTAEGELESILVQLEDRTQVGPREAQLRASEEKFGRLAETLPQMVWESDGAGNARYLSEKWHAFTGRPVRELLGRGYAEFVHPDDRGMLAAAREDAQGTVVVEFRLRRHDGEYRWMEAHIAMIRDDDGTPVQAIGTAADVTERRMAEEARVRTQKREMVGTLIGGIGHDFNNVISAILSNAALARLELASGASAETSIAEIERGAGRAADLVKRVLAQGRENVAHEPVDVGEITQEACDLLRASLPARTELRIHIDPIVPPVAGDPTQVHQLVLNLVTNARQALGGEPGAIDVAVTAEPALRHAGRPAGRDVVLRVTDDGPGMSEDVRARVFDPYFTTKPAGEGSGLGLAAVQTIVRAHSGTVGVESILGAGATFTVTLPVDETSARGGPDPAASTPAAAGSLRLLFVDDEPALVRLATRALPADGLNADGFTDPRDALAAFDAEPDRWSALVTDLSMPGLDGLTLIERVRATRPNFPVVLTSGFLRDADRERAAVLGVDAIVPKPCSMADLATAVHAAAR
ncbi:MAG: PAS domain S-box protein [Solirubrobacteraceae bacterium]|nr:PAS domain S-box protein [Solirubrobacteraceae bacterium]